MPEQQKRKFISLFSGAMGLDLGLEEAGFQTAVCVDNDQQAVETIKANCPHLPVVDRPIERVSGQEVRKMGGFRYNEKIPLVAGGPPCQAFSVFGRRQGTKDARGQLVFEFLRVVSEIQPQTFVMENVRGLLSMSLTPGTIRGSLLGAIFERFNKIGYHVDCFVVNSVNYGAPQIRERVVLIGSRFGYRPDFPGPQYSNRPEDHLPPFVTLGDVIGPGSGFKDPCPEVMNFSPRKLKYLAMVPPGGNWRSLPVDIQKESMGEAGT